MLPSFHVTPSVAIAYTLSTTSGQKIKLQGITEYVGRVTEPKRFQRRHSSFYLGLYGDTWVNFWSSCVQEITHLMELNRNKRLFYQRGLRARKLIESRF